MEQQIRIDYLITIVLFIFTAYNFFKSFKREDEASVENRVKVNVKLDQICQTTNETRTDIKSIKSEIDEIKKVQIMHSMQIEELQKKVGDEHE